MDREEAARKFAEVVGLAAIYNGPGPDTDIIACFVPKDIAADGEWAAEHEIDLPAPDAPLHEHLAFVGRIAEAVGDVPLESVMFFRGQPSPWYAKFYGVRAELAPDLSHAALLAGIAAKEVSR